MQKKHLLVTLLFISLIIVACSKNIEPQNAFSLLLRNDTLKSHRWFYFTTDGFKETEHPHTSPSSDFIPWTEAIRITSSIQADDKAYFTVNKLGILESPQTHGRQKDGIASTTILIKDKELFSHATVSDLLYLDDTVLFSFYTNPIHENTIAKEKANTSFLVKFNKNTYDFSSVLYKDAITQDKNTEIREVFYNNNEWNILLKSDTLHKKEFFAKSFVTDYSNTKTKLHSISVSEFREKIQPKKESELPQKVKDLLKPISVPCYIHLYEENAETSVQYEYGTHFQNTVQAYVQSFEHCSIAAFEDGTLLFAGHLPSKKVLNNGEPLAYKLPDLGSGYIYSNISLTGSTLIIGWEETSFYKTGKSGFLAIDMEQVLYKD